MPIPMEARHLIPGIKRITNDGRIAYVYRNEFTDSYGVCRTPNAIPGKLIGAYNKVPTRAQLIEDIQADLDGHG